MHGTLGAPWERTTRAFRVDVSIGGLSGVFGLRYVETVGVLPQLGEFSSARDLVDWALGIADRWPRNDA